MHQYKKNILGAQESIPFESHVRNVVRNDNRRNIIFIIIAMAIGFWVFQLWSTRNDNNKLNATPSVSVSIAPVAIEDVPNTINLVGTIYAYETVAVKSRIDSLINNVRFKDGDTVKEGDILFELDASILQAQFNQYQANLKRDEAQLENAKAQYDRYQKLSEKGYASREKMQEALAAFKTQTAAVNATKASLESVKAQLDYTNITAPITGRAGTINVTRGNTVKANDAQPLVTINRVKPIRAQFAIPQRYYDALREAGKGSVQVSAQRNDGQNISIGNLEYIDNTIDTATGSFNARAVFENNDEKLWPGMFVNISIILNTDKDALVIPQVAIQNGQGGAFVYVVDNATKKATKRPVEILRMQDDIAVIKSGLQAGESVATDGMLKLTDGATVEISTPISNTNK